MSDNTIYGINRNASHIDSLNDISFYVLRVACIVFACRCQQYS